MNYLIPDDLRKAIMNYLAQRPYAEVAQAMNALAQLQPAQPNKENIEPS